ncbi:NADH:ubiquinone reductase (Na(+)-transporting) subunit A [Lewinellaceae bacterium SD302]|nr:NADH:ubiquinone reductase (Na(+)-transporting) subunit A [Lewinellaceae bacterium SD302]
MGSMLKNKGLYALLLLIAISAQSQAAPGMSNLLFYGLAALAMVLFFFLIVSVADNLMVIEGRQSGADRTGANFSLFPKANELFGKKAPGYLDDEPVYSLKKGHDIPLEGKATKKISTADGVTRYAVQPPNFLGLRPIPKVTVEVGDSVKAGDVIFHDKNMDRIKFVAPVSGEVLEVRRGAKRAITEVIILADKDQQSRSYELPAADADRATLVDFLLESGVWPFIRQRPYNVVADPEVTPRDIFISTFDTAPLAADLSYTVEGRMDAFQAGLDVLNRLTDGLVYLGLDGRGDEAPSPVFTEAKGVQKRYFRGAHPAGNVGVQIHHIHPAGPKDKIWTLNVDGVLTIGELFLSGRYDASRLVALTGAPMAEPHYVRTHVGANVGELLKGLVINKKDGEAVRYISGNVLTGQEKNEDQFLNFRDNQVTLITEGSEPEIFGWLLPLKQRASISPTIPVLTDHLEVTTNTHGEKRAFVVTNDYEQVMPMDIYTQQLMKAILVNDFETMEGLGIYELVEEDVALAEFACVSKQPLQSILRKGLDTMREQG